MKEIDPLNLPVQDNTVQEIKFPKTKKEVGKLVKPHAGMTLFAVDVKSKECEPVKFEASSLPQKVRTKNPLPGKRMTDNLAKRAQLTLEAKQMEHLVTAKEGVFYVWAINEKNAMKKFRKAF